MILTTFRTKKTGQTTPLLYHQKSNHIKNKKYIHKLLLYGALFLNLPSSISANITTLQSWDPIPLFNAANLNMPPDTQFCHSIKKRIVDEDSDKRRRWGLNVSPFVQKAIRAQETEEIYFGQSGLATITAGRQMGDYQGTPYLMGLFLGQDTNGNSIWGGPAALDTGLVTDITTENLDNMSYLPTNLKNAIAAMNDNANPVTTVASSSTDYNAIIYGLATNPGATIPNTAPSIFSQSVLEQDKLNFGAISVPLTYQKAGFRWELNFDFSDSVGFIARGGFCQITQRTAALTSLSANSSIYNKLNNVQTGSTTTTNIEAQNTFNQWVPNNIEYLLDPTNGADYDISTFSGTGIEDLQFLAFVRHPFALHPVDTDKYSPIILTPYLIFGCTAPLAPVKDYYKLYSLPFGNNGHLSLGGVVGLAFDFINNLEVGFECGATAFLPKTIDEVPCPNHPLQRVFYPYRQQVNYEPGFNGQFAFIFNAYKFAPNTSFSFRYNYVHHNQDSITLVTPSQYFLPEMLEELSLWNSQMFIAALTFELQPSIYLSIAWQGALSQKNAYCSNTILGSLNFQF